jgi:hypothetical protein
LKSAVTRGPSVRDRSTLLFPAHRSYRRLRRVTPGTIVQTLALLLVLEGALLFRADWISALVGRAALALVPPLHTPVALVSNSYFGVRVQVLSFVLPASTYWVQLLWLAGGALVLGAAVAVKKIPIPVRVFAGFAAVLVCVSAYYILVFGHIGFDGYDVSRLYIRTAMVVWLLLPILLTASSVALPFTKLERVALLVGCVGVDIAFSLVRYAFFVWFIGSVGPIPMPMLYLLLGPALDFLYVIGIASVALVRLSYRLDHAEGPETWTWT